MSKDLRLSRIHVSDSAWRSFRAAAIAQGMETPVLLGSVIEGYLRRYERQKAKRIYERS